MFYIDSRMEEDYIIKLDIPENYEIASSMEARGKYAKSKEDMIYLQNLQLFAQIHFNMIIMKFMELNFIYGSKENVTLIGKN